MSYGAVPDSHFTFFVKIFAKLSGKILDDDENCTEDTKALKKLNQFIHNDNR